MSKQPTRRCAIYTRKSSEEGLDQSFNSLDAQREACEAYIKSQAHEGWKLVAKQYDDGGFSGGTMARPGIQALMADIDKGQVDIVVVYKVDRLTRSLTDFSKIVDVLDRKGASFVSVTQQFNTTTSMGRLTLNVLLSFAQFEREVTGERIRDKVAASKKKGMWMGGFPPLGYDILNRKLSINDAEAETVRSIYDRFLELRSIRALAADLRKRAIVSKQWKTRHGTMRGGNAFSRGALYHLLRNRLYLGQIAHKGSIHAGEHPAIVPEEVWERAQLCLGAKVVNRPPQRRSASGFLLTGLIFDDRGNRMSPSHAKKKNGQRYRYYVSQAVLQHRPDEAGSLKRISAQAIEDLVADRIRRIVRPAESDRSVEAKPCTVTHEVASQHIHRVEIGKELVTLSIADGRADPAKLRVRFDQSDLIEEVGDGFQIKIPIRLKTWGGEKIIEGPNGGSPTTRAHVDESLTIALVRAFSWREQLADGSTRSLEEIAARERCTEAYVRQIIELAFLAPDIIERILAGTQPRHVTVDRLVRMTLPLSWRDQRRQLGLVR